jgi:S1-C subfamily serine protease
MAFMAWFVAGVIAAVVAPPALADEPSELVEALESAVIGAIERARPSVVAITRIRSADGVTRAVRGMPVEPDPELDRGIGIGLGMPEVRPGFPNEAAPEFYAVPGESGSGVVIGSQGEILTAYHLVRGARRLRVRSERAEFDAEIIAADPRTDLAVIVPRAGSNMPEPLVPLTIGTAERLRPGSFLVTLGNPYNAARDGKATASFGILANVARRIEPPRGDNPNIRQFFQFQPTLLQLDNRLNLGMSGGAVVTLKGELVGITSSEASASGFDAAAGYAIPLDARGRRAVASLIKGEEVEYGFIGISLGPGANVVGRVREGTLAWKAELAPGDRILAVGDRELADDESALPLALAEVPAGATVTLKVLHQGQVVERRVVMSKYPVAGEVIATVRPEPWRGARIDFSSVLASTTQNTEETLELMTRGGVGVIEVAPGSPADAAGLARGDVIAAVDGKPVATPAEFRGAVADRAGKPVKLTVRSGLDEEREVVVEGL